MRLTHFAAILAVIAGVGGVFWYRQVDERSKAARREATIQKQEQDECRKRLASFHQAWTTYRAQHKGVEPPTPESLFPKYVRSGDLLACPTALRLRKEGKVVDQGSLKLEGKDYPMTYGFLWLSATYGRALALDGEKAPLVRCDVHRDGMYMAVYHKRPPLGAFSDGHALASEVTKAPVLAVRRSGEVVALASYETD
jgi:hypothetical protein